MRRQALAGLKVQASVRGPAAFELFNKSSRTVSCPQSIYRAPLFGNRCPDHHIPGHIFCKVIPHEAEKFVALGQYLKISHRRLCHSLELLIHVATQSGKLLDE